MIPVKVDAETFYGYVDNVVAAYRAATPEQSAKGEQWYTVAHDLALMVGNGDVRMGAGVIAALSANKSWAENIRLATQCATGDVRGHFADALRKVTIIMSGTDPESVLPMHSKTGQFYACIVDPSDPVPVCIDRHAHDVAVGEVYGQRDRGLSSKGRYETLANVYREAAARLGLVPSTLQAIVWVAHLERIR